MINNIKERIKEYSEMIEKYPDIKEFHIERAKLYCETGFNKEAEKFYTKAINKDKNNINSYINRLYFYIRIREMEKAISDCKAILKLSPKEETILNLKRILTGK